MRGLLLLLLASPACAQLRKITPVPPPAMKVVWAPCADEMTIGRFSGTLKCSDGVARHVEVLVYQPPRADTDRLEAQLILSKSAADRGGTQVTGAFTDDPKNLIFNGEIPPKDMATQAIPVRAVLKRMIPDEGGLVYKVDGNLGDGRKIQGQAVPSSKAMKVFIAVTSSGQDKGDSCEGELKKTQKFLVSCSE